MATLFGKQLLLRLQPLGRSIPRESGCKTRVCTAWCRSVTTVPDGIINEPKTKQLTENRQLAAEPGAEIPLSEYRFIYSDFLRNPDSAKYNPVLQRLERKDMLLRRIALCIPEFYVGSVLAVTVTDVNAPGKTSRFVGICIHRADHGLRHFFILRNVVEGNGIEILYDLYNPTILSIEVLKLEKRLDNMLFYLRDAPAEYSTFPFNMEITPHADGAPVPVNPLKVPLNPPPWTTRWEKQDFEGMEPLPLKEDRFRRAVEISAPWIKYDLMNEYRQSIPKDQQMEVFSELQEYHKWNSQQTRQLRRRRKLVKPVKTA